MDYVNYTNHRGDSHCYPVLSEFRDDGVDYLVLPRAVGRFDIEPPFRVVRKRDTARTDEYFLDCPGWPRNTG